MTLYISPKDIKENTINFLNQKVLLKKKDAGGKKIQDIKFRSYIRTDLHSYKLDFRMYLVICTLV